MTIAPLGPLTAYVDLPEGTVLDGGPEVAEVLSVLVDLPGGALYAAPPRRDTPAGMRLAILDASKAVLTPDLRNRMALSGVVEDGGPGAVSVTLSMDDFEALDPDWLDPNNLMRVYLDGTSVAEALMDAAPPVQLDNGTWVHQIDGRGSEAILDNGVLYPEVWHEDEDRQFDYSSQRTPYGGWYVASDWHVPHSRSIRTSFRWTENKRHWPKGWPDTAGRWLWSSDPERGSYNGPRWFRSEFTTSEAMNVRIWAAGDDTLQLKLDGNVIMSVAQGGWHKARSVKLRLEAGGHVIAARVTNMPGGLGTELNASGFACSIGKLDSHSRVTYWIRRTATPSLWVVTTRPVPGWYPPLALRAHVIEGRSRGVQGYSGITWGFTDTHDSAGRPWVWRRDLSIPIGTSGTGIVDLVRQHGYQVAMLPGLRLAVWRSRGRNLHSIIRLGGKVTQRGFTSRVWSRVKTAVLTHAAFGWRAYRSDLDGLNTAYGRRETMLSAGNAKSGASAERQSLATLRDVATPEETIDIQHTNAEGPQPFLDYTIADLINVQYRGRWITARVKSIAFTQTDTGISWTTTVYPLAVPI